MKKHLNLAPFLAAAAGVAGALLRSWLLKAGTDDRGLYPSGHPGWIGYVILSVAMIVGLYLLTREAEAAPPAFPPQAMRWLPWASSFSAKTAPALR